VESVSWVAERKDVLYTFFFIGGLLFYLKYLETGMKKILFYFSALILFIVSVLCKPASVTMPVIMLLIDFYLSRKFDRKCWLEKIPFFAVSVIFGIISIKAQSAGAAISAWDTMAIHNRLFFASYSFLAYLFKFFFPVHLSAFYPYPTRFPIKEALPFIYYAAPVIALGLFFAVYKTIKISRVYIFGFLFYFFSVALVLQFVSVGAAIMADRYTYVPYIGIAFIAGMEFDRLYNSKKTSLNFLKYLVIVILIGYGIAFSYLTFQRTKVWKNNETLWTDVIEKFPLKVEVAYKNRGNYYAREMKLYDKALKDYDAYISINPADPSIYSNRGNLYGLMKRYDLSLSDYNKALAIDSLYNDAFVNRAVTYMAMKKFDSALIDVNKAIRLNPQGISGHKNRAYCYVNLGRNEEAIDELNKMLIKENDDYNLYFFRGIALFNSKKYKEAIEDFNRTIQLNPSHGESYMNRSKAYKILGDHKNALSDALKAKQLGQNITEEYLNSLK
jgi:protein O-mannosyl-transferase